MAKKVRAARHYQRDDDPVLRLSRSAMRGVARELQHAFNNLSSMVPVDKVAEAIRNGRDPKGLINWHHYREVLRGAFDRLGKLRHSGGALGARKINGAFAAKRRKVRFRKAGYTHFVSEGAVLSAAKFAATRKASKAEAGYEERSSHGVSCSGCWMFQAVWQCCAVEGVINPNGWCTYWETVFSKGYNPDEPRDERGRWTTGGASAPEGTTAGGSGPTMEGRDDEVLSNVRAVAEQQGFDPNKIDISSEDRKFTLNGREFNYAGAADLQNGRITLYPKQITPGTTVGLTAHEIMHQKYEAFNRDLAAEREAVMNDPRTLADMKPDGTLRTLGGEYPLYSEYERIVGMAGHEGFEKTDGVTGYSNDWWKAARSQTASWSQAVHETLAEIGRLKTTGEEVRNIVTKPNGFLTTKALSRQWAALYRVVNSNWKKRHT